jgi:hypothetical protein
MAALSPTLAMSFENRGVILYPISALIDQQAADFKDSGLVAASAEVGRD